MKNVMIVVMVLTATLAFAQEPEEKIMERKKEFLAQRMELEEKQKQPFFDLYEEMHAQKKDLRIEMQQNRLTLQKSTLTEKEANNVILKEFEIKQRLLDLEKDYHKKYATVISSKQLIEYYKSEDDFNRMLMGRLRGQHQPNRPERPGMPREHQRPDMPRDHQRPGR